MIETFVRLLRCRRASRSSRRPRRRHSFRLGLLAAILAVTSHEVAVAGVNSEMNDFFQSMGGAGGGSGPQAYQGQSAGYYTGGSLWARFPTKTVSPINIALPSVKAGCGGIDVFGGSFSFINGDEFVAMAKSVASNAVGFAFQLAIDSISEMIGANLKDLRNVIQKANEFNMNSCEMAQGLVGGLWGKAQGKDSYVCKAIANSQGWATDWAKSRQECNKEGTSADMANKNKDPNTPAGPYNYTWTMLAKSYPNFDTDFREGLMSIVGTIVYAVPTPNRDGGNYKYFGSKAQGIMIAMLDGGTAPGLACDETEKCLNPRDTTITVAPANALKPRIYQHISNMLWKVRSNQALSQEEIGILGATSIPLYKIITVNAAVRAGMSPGEIQSLSEAVAVDLLEVLVREWQTYVTQGSSSFQNADEVTLGQWREQVRDVGTALAQQGATLTGRVERLNVVLEQTQLLERRVRNMMSPQMSAAMNFAGGLSAMGAR